MSKSRSFGRRGFIQAGALAATGAALSSCATSARKPDKPLNVVFYMVDQLRAQALSYAGETNIKTPNIDKLATQGMLFTNSISACPVCTPYRGMLVTGKYGTHSGVLANFVNIHPSNYSIADAFNAAGYDTGYFGKWHLSSGWRTWQGLYAAETPEEAQAQQARAEAYMKENPEAEFTPPGEARMGFKDWGAYNFHMDFVNPFYYKDKPEKVFMKAYETDGLTNMCIDYIKAHEDGDTPFFLVVAPHPPHPPYTRQTSPEGSFDRVKERLDYRPNVNEYDSEFGQGHVDPHEYNKYYDPRAYYAMITNIDDNIGRLMDYLDESGMGENTLLVFTSDHGEMLFSHGRMNKMVPYEESVMVPLIFRCPGMVPEDETDVLYSNIDHMPTLLSLCGIEPPEGLDGLDLSNAVLGKPCKEHDAVFMMNYTSNWDFFSTGTQWPEWRGLRTKRYTYAKYLDGREELFDNQVDPYQLTNLAEDEAANAELLAKMRNRLKELLADADDDFRPGTQYAEWFTPCRDLKRTALGPVE